MKLSEYLRKQHANQQQKKASLEEARGDFLGNIKIGYAGGLGKEFKNDAKHPSAYGTLSIYARRVEYSHPSNSFIIKADAITSIEVGGQELVTSRVTATRLLTLGVFALAAPKKSKVKQANVIIELDEGEQVLFQTTLLSNFDVQRELADAVSHFNRHHATNQRAADSLDPAKEIMRYAILHKHGAITDEEFQAKKEQLLGL
jgi:Short C-terminal domain